MLKRLFTLISILFVFQVSNAQKRDTVVYYMENNGRLAANKDSADYLRLVISPDSGSTLYNVHEYYLSGKVKTIGTSANRDSLLQMHGNCVQFYPNGKRLSVLSFNQYSNLTDMIYYYPNGKLYAIYKFAISGPNLRNKLNLVQYRDSTGNILAENGNGHWVRFDAGFTKALEEGDVKDGLEEGEWHGAPTDSITYTCTYHKGMLVSGTSYKNGAAYHFTEKEVEPHLNDFNKFLARNIRYPDGDKQNHVQGKVWITFTVEKNGTLTHFNILKAPSASLAGETLRVLKLSPLWSPELYYGIPVAMRYTVPVSFSIGGDK